MNSNTSRTQSYLFVDIFVDNIDVLRVEILKVEKTFLVESTVMHFVRANVLDSRSACTAGYNESRSEIHH